MCVVDVEKKTHPIADHCQNEERHATAMGTTHYFRETENLLVNHIKNVSFQRSQKNLNPI